MTMGRNDLNISNNSKLVVISGVSLVEGGTLRILADCISEAERYLGREWEIVILVHKKQLISSSRCHIIEYPWVKRSWLSRLFVEWVSFYGLSRSLKPDLWLSLHDITPRVVARRQVVYAHNPSPFYQISLAEAWLEPKFAVFCIFYRYLYRVFIKRNNIVIVQQVWIRDAFRKMFGNLPLLVAYPNVEGPSAIDMKISESRSDKTIFLYPALPRIFKNFEVLCQAVERLETDIRDRVEIRMTIDGTETRYARRLLKRFGGISALKFIGRMSREQINIEYIKCNVVLFPSKLETWGLPISEAKACGKELLVADLPYARETVGSYKNVSFITPNDHQAWAKKITSIVRQNNCHQGNIKKQPNAPFARDWHSLWTILVSGL